ncbi:DNA replication complex GINS protein SLD5 [Halenospora varia]|nr:DNA replication complex GINS protein SLD5 [Halenospora varia]
MDISDILSDLDHQHDPLSDDFDSGLPSGEADLQSLTRAWVNERGTLELLPWPENNLIERITTRIKHQIETIERMTGDEDPKTNFSLIIIQTEVERWKFLMRSFLRARIAKIDKHALYYLQEDSSQSDTQAGREGRMSDIEKAYATRHQELLAAHFGDSFLAGFPQHLRGLDDRIQGEMVGGPDAESGVFVRGLGGNGSVDEGQEGD